jgi:hypothetical protein
LARFRELDCPDCAGKRKYISAFLDFLEQSESDPLSRHNTRVCDGFSVSDAIRPEPAEA